MTDKGFLHRRTKNFGKLPYTLIVDKNITAGAARLYAYMHWRYGSNRDNHESRESMADTMGVSKRTITKYLQELELADWIAIIARKGKHGSATNFYHVFELQEDCKLWRKHRQRPKPTHAIEQRKGRIGIGGKPTHNTVNSSSSSKRNGDKVNSSSPTPLNSSSHDPDSYDPEKKQGTPPPIAKTNQQPSSADSSNDGQPRSDSDTLHGFHTGDAVWVWSDKRRDFVQCTVTRETARYVWVVYSNIHGAHQEINRAPHNVYRDKPPTTFEDLTPAQQVVGKWTQCMRPGEGVPTSTLVYIRTVLKRCEERFRTTMPNADELERVFAWNKGRGRDTYTNPDKIPALVGEYRQEYRPQRPINGHAEFIYVPGCKACTFGMVVNEQGHSEQCPVCLEAHNKQEREAAS